MSENKTEVDRNGELLENGHKVMEVKDGVLHFETPEVLDSVEVNNMVVDVSEVVSYCFPEVDDETLTGEEINRDVTIKGEWGSEWEDEIREELEARGYNVVE